MKSGATKLKKQEPSNHSSEFLRRPAKLQPPGREKYKHNRIAQWDDEEDDENLDLFAYDDGDEIDDEEHPRGYQ
jgi:hypothetical protein